MSGREKPAMSRTTWVVIVALGIGVVLLGVFAQPRGETAVPAASTAPSDTATATAPAGTADGEPAATVETPAEPTDEQAAAQAFLVEELPRRQDGDPLALGAVDAPVVLTEWADYRCPYCSVFAEETLPGLLSYVDDGTLRIEFRDLAIFGDESIKAATAARAAGEQGKYFEFQHALFVALPNDGHPDVPDDLVMGIVDDLGLDAARFATDWEDPALTNAVLSDTLEAQQMGITSTPAFVIGGQFVAGAQPLETFAAVIEQQAALLG